ncbi:equilibrative nucleoside transporter 4 [Phymastichus coffea]|uniref:equilibrative nucleoside transporter 4 n=1 Tax=Phymastichus coffea TaxID=108790 RepID=UPI00273BDBA2|nr:equilibrative nucleoside transporter 4 [Phymastichus coffea]XP_058792733.1 equilibrative nucleoside transporter 4 [Phymastichus coffea]
MDENLSRGYVQLGKARRMNEFKYSENGFARIAPPVDRWNLVYLSLVLAGAGFLLPYNSFIIAVDYFQARYPGTTVVFDMSVVYIMTAFFAVLLNNTLVETLSLGTRITFGYLVSFLTLNFVVLCEVSWEVFGVATSYNINLIAVAVVSLGCTVQQSSFYGYTSMLPSRYTQAVMAGESAAGFWVSVNRIVTKSLVEDERGNTSMFFALSILTIVICFILQQIIYKTEFVQYYINMCQERNKITLEPQEDAGLVRMDLDQGADPSRGQYGILKLTSPLATDSASGSADMTNNAGQFFEFSFSNPVYDPNAPTTTPGSAGPTYKVEDIIVMHGNHGTTQSRISKRFAGVRRGLIARMEVAKLIYPYMTSIGIAYFVTLCLYPGIISEIISCRFGSWMPVILMTSFNGADLTGKMLATLPVQWTRSQLMNFSCARFLMIPLFLMCAIPRRAPVLSNELFPVILSVILGITNGIVGSVPMVQAPSKVSEEYRELAGNIMTLSYTTGLTFGSILAYMLDALLGAPLTAKQICPKPDISAAINVSPMSVSNVTLNLLSTTATTLSSAPSTTPSATTFTLSTLGSTLAAIEKVSKKVNASLKRASKAPKIRTTATTLFGLASTAFVTSGTSEAIFGVDMANATSTALPNLLANVTMGVSNAVRDRF